MSCRGVHFALTEEEIARLRSFADDKERLCHLMEVIETQYFSGDRRFVGESDKAWDAMHRVLTDGSLDPDGGQYPLNRTVLGGESLYAAADYILSLKTPQEVRDIAAALLAITEADFRQRYFAIDVESYAVSLSEDDLEYTWEWFQDVRDFYTRAASAGRHVLFTVDQ